MRVKVGAQERTRHREAKPNYSLVKERVTVIGTGKCIRGQTN